MEDIIKLHDGLPSLSEVEAACDELVLYSGRIKKPGYTPAQRVMAQVYDYCQEQKHHFFIITTYEHWMFGVFLQDYTCAAVTEPLPYDHKGPTIVQCITYWLQSSLFLPGSFEIPEDSMALTDPGSFDRYFTGLMWRRTLRTWRLRAVHELRNLSRHAKTKSLVDACCRSLEKLGTSPSSLVSRKAHLIDRCRHVVDQIRPRPTSLHEWTVILTWLAVVLDPIALDDGLQSLEEAFVIAADRSPDHPITEDQAHRKRKSLVDSRKARGATARLLQPNDSLDNDGTIHGFYWRYASKEVALILDRYLPTEIRLQLQRWNDRAPFTCVPRNSPLEPRISPLEPQNPPLEPRSLHLEPRNSRPEPRSEQLEPRNLHHEPKKSQPEPQSSHLEPQNQHPELRSSQVEPRNLQPEPRNSQPVPGRSQPEPRNQHPEPSNSHLEPRTLHSEPRNSHLESRNLQPEPQNSQPVPGRSQPEPRNQHPEPSNSHLEPRTLHSEPRNSHLESRNLHPEPRSQHPEPRDQHPGPSTSQLELRNSRSEPRNLHPELRNSQIEPRNSCYLSVRRSAEAELPMVRIVIGASSEVAAPDRATRGPQVIFEIPKGYRTDFSAQVSW